MINAVKYIACVLLLAEECPRFLFAERLQEDDSANIFTEFGPKVWNVKESLMREFGTERAEVKVIRAKNVPNISTGGRCGDRGDGGEMSICDKNSPNIWMGVMIKGQTFDCDEGSYDICTLDAIMFCLTNGTIITGTCKAKRAICLEGKKLDTTLSACSRSDGRLFDCSSYDHRRCTKDSIPFCLSNGTIARGRCQAMQAVCVEKQHVDDSFGACNKAGSASGQKNTGLNSANTMTVTISLLLAMLLLLSAGV